MLFDILTQFNGITENDLDPPIPTDVMRGRHRKGLPGKKSADVFEAWIGLVILTAPSLAEGERIIHEWIVRFVLAVVPFAAAGFQEQDEELANRSPLAPSKSKFVATFFFLFAILPQN